MKKFFIILTVGLLLSTPHTTHSRGIIRSTVLITAGGYVAFSVYERYQKAIAEKSKDPNLDAALTIPELGAEALLLTSHYAKKAGIALAAAVEAMRLELKTASKNTAPETTPKASQDDSSEQK